MVLRRPRYKRGREGVVKILPIKPIPQILIQTKPCYKHGSQTSSLQTRTRGGFNPPRQPPQFSIPSSQSPVLNLNSQFSVLSFSILSSQFSVLNSQFSIPSSQSPVLKSQISILSSQFSVLNPQFSILSSQSSILNPQFSILSSQFSVLNKSKK